jgi:hypothetical protein
MSQRRLLILIQVFTLLLILQAGAVSAQSGPQPLPALPSSAILNQIISQTNGPTFTPLMTPNALRNQLIAFNGALNGVEDILRYNQAVSYFDRAGNLMEHVIPLVNNATASIRPNITLPGVDPRPGRIIGATWQRGRGMMVMALGYNSWASHEQPSSLRFYHNSTDFTFEGFNFAPFIDYGNDGRLELADQGGVIARHMSCVSVGLTQVCWWPNESRTRDLGIAPSIDAAAQRAHNRYWLSVSFSGWHALPDLAGAGVRTSCRNAALNASSFNNLSACQANILMTATTSAPFSRVGFFDEASFRRGVCRGARLCARLRATSPVRWGRGLGVGMTCAPQKTYP